MHKLTIIFASLILTISITAYGQNQQNIDVMRFNQVMNYINYAYVDTVNDSQLIDAAINAVLEKLDPHSAYIPKTDVEDANERIRGDFVGIGVRFQMIKDTFNIVSVIPGGPSEKVGLLDDDKIISVDGELIAGKKLKTTEIRKKLMGEMNTKVKLQIVRGKNNELMDFTITRGKIQINSVDCAYMIDKNIGYIKLNSFSQSTTKEMDSSIALLKAQGMKQLILDLQSNGGGLMYSARDLADNFLSGDKLIVYSQGRKQPRADLNAGSRNAFEKGDLIVLVNEFSASASEIVSGAIQDWDRGLVVGRRTFGKGLVQKPIPLIDGSEIRLTIARYYTPSGRNIQKPYDKGVKEYRNDYMERWEHGEMVSEDSISFPDSLKFQTLIKKRTVYGGGGIMPDVFVPLDTTSMSPYFNKLFRGGYFNTFAFEYAKENKQNLKEKYPTVLAFKDGFNIDDKLRDSFTSFANKEDSTVVYNEEEYTKDKFLIETRLKGIIASDIYGFEQSYQILNELNDPLKKAVQIFQSGEYKKYKLAK